MSGSRLSPGDRTNRTNSLAIAALVCGVVEFVVPLAFIAAIVLGHKARRQIRRTGEDGYGLATAGLVLGYLLLALGVLGILFALLATAAAPQGPVR